MERVFLSHTFDDADRDLVNHVSSLIESVGLVGP